MHPLKGNTYNLDRHLTKPVIKEIIEKGASKNSRQGERRSLRENKQFRWNRRNSHYSSIPFHVLSWMFNVFKLDQSVLFIQFFSVCRPGSQHKSVCPKQHFFSTNFHHITKVDNVKRRCKPPRIDRLAKVLLFFDTWG